MMNFGILGQLILNESKIYNCYNNNYLFLEHDARNEIITVQHNEKRMQLKEICSCIDVF